MNDEGPYRHDPITKTLDDHDGRLDVLEFFADGRAKCTGDELWHEIHEIEVAVKNLKVCVFAVTFGFIAWIIIDLMTMEGLHEEHEQELNNLGTKLIFQELEIKTLKDSLKCISEHSYKIAEARDSL